MTANRILLVDDDESFLRAMTVRLRAEGFDVTTAQDAIQGLRFAREHAPDLLLLDINMPAGDGFSVQRRLAEMDDVGSIPVIYVTGDKSQRIAKGAHRLGAVALFHKPFASTELVQAIRAALGAAEVQDHALADLQKAADNWCEGRAGIV